jgi:hypothetical protein
MEFMESPGNLQRYAYGQKIAAIFTDRDFVFLDSVDRLKKVHQLAAEFIVVLGSEMETQLSNPNLPEPEDRCRCLEEHTHRQCMRERKHDGTKCKFTPKGSICMTTAKNLISTMTVGDIKRLSGLDDTKVLKGMENFISIRKYAKQYGGPDCERLLQQVDEVELFYKTDYIPHLKRTSDHQCNCLTCGFHDEGTSCSSRRRISYQPLHYSHHAILPCTDNPNDVVCPSKDSHKRCCVPCSKGFGVIVELILSAQEKLSSLQAQTRSTNEEQARPTNDNAPAGAAVSDIMTLPTGTGTGINPPPLDFESLAQAKDTSHWIKALDNGSMSIEEFAPLMQEFGAKLSTSSSQASKNRANKTKLRGWLLAPWQLRGVYFRGVKELREFASRNAIQFNATAKATKLRDTLAEHFTETEVQVDEEEPRPRADPNNPLTPPIPPPPNPDIIRKMQQIEEDIHELHVCRDNLVEYRSHLARHKSEDEFASQQYVNLQDDEAIITSDYKMKVLACFFRENQKKWFGKRGTSVLGFMIATNPVDQEDKEKGIKDLQFVMMITDDTLQDDWEVACAKHWVIKNCLSENIKKFHFIADGAGCFKSVLHRAIQPLWALWTGVEEKSFRITPAGDGKSPLDGMFGRLGCCLSSSADTGNSYYDADTTLDTLADSDGLASTLFMTFKPNRGNDFNVESASLKFGPILLTTLDSSSDEGPFTLHAYKHSGFGSGIELHPFKDFVFYKGAKANKIQVYRANVSSWAAATLWFDMLMPR